MSGNGMTGERGRRGYETTGVKMTNTKTGFIISGEDLLNWLNTLRKEFTLFGPVLKRKKETVFEKINDAHLLNLDYCTTMASPRRFIYPSRQDLFNIHRRKNKIQTVFPDEENIIIVGIHPCDTHAISVLDRTFLGDFKDVYYRTLRKKAVTIVLNCRTACQKAYPSFIFRGFCASMDTGPFLKLKEGFDIELTLLAHRVGGSTAPQKDYLLEFGSQRARALVKKATMLRRATEKDFVRKGELEKSAVATFTKTVDTRGCAELLARNLDHPVYKNTAEAKCLNCTNCTMVCPTCYCYDVKDYTSFDLKTTARKRHWDSCYELHFARVHGGNFRSSREARLRQFVTHKLSTWIEQYGCYGCVGCGRCMTWCPTNIDLTEMVKEIQEDLKRGNAR